MAKSSVILSDSKKELIEKCVFQHEKKNEYKERGKYNYCYDLNVPTTDCIFPIIFLDIPDILSVVQEINIKYRLIKGFRTRSLDRIAIFSVDEDAKKLYLLSSTWAQKFSKNVNRPYDRSVTLHLSDMQDLDLNNVSFLCIYLTRKNRVLAISKIFRMRLVIFEEKNIGNKTKIQNSSLFEMKNEIRPESHIIDKRHQDEIFKTVTKNDDSYEDNWIIVKSKPKKYMKKVVLKEHSNTDNETLHNVLTAIKTTSSINSSDRKAISNLKEVENLDKFAINTATENSLNLKLPSSVEITESDKHRNIDTLNIINYNQKKELNQIIINDFNNEYIFSEIKSLKCNDLVKNIVDGDLKLSTNKCASGFDLRQATDITNSSYLPNNNLIDSFNQEGKQQLEILVEQEYDWTTNGINSSINCDRNQYEDVEYDDDNIIRDLLTAEENVSVFEKKIIHYLGLLLKQMLNLHKRIEDGDKAHGEIVEKLDNILKKESKSIQMLVNLQSDDGPIANLKTNLPENHVNDDMSKLNVINNLTSTLIVKEIDKPNTDSIKIDKNKKIYPQIFKSDVANKLADNFSELPKKISIGAEKSDKHLKSITEANVVNFSLRDRRKRDCQLKNNILEEQDKAFCGISDFNDINTNKICIETTENKENKEFVKVSNKLNKILANKNNQLSKKNYKVFSGSSISFKLLFRSDTRINRLKNKSYSGSNMTIRLLFGDEKPAEIPKYGKGLALGVLFNDSKPKKFVPRMTYSGSALTFKLLFRERKNKTKNIYSGSEIGLNNLFMENKNELLQLEKNIQDSRINKAKKSQNFKIDSDSGLKSTRNCISMDSSCQIKNNSSLPIAVKAKPKPPINTLQLENKAVMDQINPTQNSSFSKDDKTVNKTTHNVPLLQSSPICKISETEISSLNPISFNPNLNTQSTSLSGITINKHMVPLDEARRLPSFGKKPICIDSGSSTMLEQSRKDSVMQEFKEPTDETFKEIKSSNNKAKPILKRYKSPKRGQSPSSSKSKRATLGVVEFEDKVAHKHVYFDITADKVALTRYCQELCHRAVSEYVASKTFCHDCQQMQSICDNHFNIEKIEKIKELNTDKSIKKESKKFISKDTDIIPNENDEFDDTKQINSDALFKFKQKYSKINNPCTAENEAYRVFNSKAYLNNYKNFTETKLKRSNTTIREKLSESSENLQALITTIHNETKNSGNTSMGIFSLADFAIKKVVNVFKEYKEYLLPCEEEEPVKKKIRGRRNAIFIGNSKDENKDPDTDAEDNLYKDNLDMKISHNGIYKEPIVPMKKSCKMNRPQINFEKKRKVFRVDMVSTQIDTDSEVEENPLNKKRKIVHSIDKDLTDNILQKDAKFDKNELFLKSVKHENDSFLFIKKNA